jgi:hypothetical protein
MMMAEPARAMEETVAPPQPRRAALDEVAINDAIASMNLKFERIKDGTLYLKLTVPEASISEEEMEALPRRLVGALKRLPFVLRIHTISFG